MNNVQPEWNIESEFETIRPYFDHEINSALQRITEVPEFNVILDFIFPGQDKSVIIDNLTKTDSIKRFQKTFMHPLVYSIINKTSAGLSISGFDKLIPGTPYLFVANHRDIVLDSAILQVVLIDEGHETSEITFGSNLMINQFIIDLGKVNRMFRVTREGNQKELLRNSQLLSAYIRNTITQKHTSVWIAQRGGRTKDGNDLTETGLLKMLRMSGACDFTASFRELNIVPLVVSYEYETCCTAKVRELMALSKQQAYIKAPGEDFKSIIDGITQQKGRIHLAACTPVNEFLHETESCKSNNEKISAITGFINNQIYRNYKLWPFNFIASDQLNNTRHFIQHYTHADLEQFNSYKKAELKTPHNTNLHEKLLLNIYANPVVNAIRAGVPYSNQICSAE